MGMTPRGVPALAVLALPMLAACSEASEPPPPTRAGHIRVDEAQIWYQTVGQGPPVIVVHGGPGLDHTYLLPGLEPLADSSRLILYDQRGLGSSSVPLDSTTITMTRFLDDIDGLRAQVADTRRVTLLAHSWGTIPALLYAMRWPQRVESLVLVSPVEPGQRFAEQANANQAAQRRPEDVAAMDSISASQAFQRGVTSAVNRLFFHVFRGTFANPEVADSLFRPRFLDRTARQGRVVATLLMAPLAGLDFWDQLPALDVPILIVHGREDPVPVEMVRELAAALPQARLVEVPDAGHFPFIEQPEATFGAIDDFFREVRTPR